MYFFMKNSAKDIWSAWKCSRKPVYAEHAELESRDSNGVAVSARQDHNGSAGARGCHRPGRNVRPFSCGGAMGSARPYGGWDRDAFAGVLVLGRALAGLPGADFFGCGAARVRNRDGPSGLLRFGRRRHFRSTSRGPNLGTLAEYSPG